MPSIVDAHVLRVPYKMVILDSERILAVTHSSQQSDVSESVLYAHSCHLCRPQMSRLQWNCSTCYQIQQSDPGDG